MGCKGNSNCSKKDRDKNDFSEPNDLNDLIDADNLIRDYPSSVNHPAHYGGENNPYEAIKVIEAWGLGFCLGNAVKYISRAGKKDPLREIEDLEKAIWYIQRKIRNLRKE